MQESYILTMNLKAFFQSLQKALHLMAGVPSYQAYVIHHQKTHPEAPLLSEKEFFLRAQKERYGGGVGRCC